MARLIVILILFGLGVAAYLFGRDYVRKHPQDVPWTPLRLDDPIGRFTLRKLVALRDDPAQCRALLRQAGSADTAAAPRLGEPNCGYRDGVTLLPAKSEARFAPPNVVTSCPVAAAMLVFERQILQPAAARHLSSRVVEVRHAGSYSCRRLYGQSEGEFSEHATANALDIIGFGLADGTDVSVLRDWAAGAKGAFLRDVHDGGCDLFATALSPDYNAAHADHLHFDQAERGRSGFSVCR
ncbi:extensin-like domain-containing protein [Sphingomonas lutea]|uniref:extensin-like domain-containing protein n=1 Tax=Sphingomonas lutea TaxID=1045317 RepID=UPI001F410730|nr:extensin family protein [Sphingomonas lutea]